MFLSNRSASDSLIASILLKAKRFGIFSILALTATLVSQPLSINTQSAHAQIAVDGSTATEVKGNVISPTGQGTVNGGNLYNSFDRFNVPNSGVIFNTGTSSVDGGRINNIINRVTGDTPSNILGTIESRQAFPNANLYLLNPNGVIFGVNARLDIGGSFHTTTGTGLGFDQNQKFNVDKNSLSFPSGDPKNIQFGISQPATIINQGNLTVDAGKNISLTAGTVVNTGNLTAPAGNVNLAAVSGNSQVELRSPDLVLGFAVNKDVIPSNWNGEISTLSKLAESLTGKVSQANQVVIKADGTISLVASPSPSDIAVKDGMAIASGKIDVSSDLAKGGNVGIFGNQVGLVNSLINASGSTGGGTVLIGGDFQGKGIAPNALQTYIDSSSQIFANGLLTGDGGKVIIWADKSTQFFGAIAARGGEIAGNGGFVEVSGKQNLNYQGSTDTLAPNGKIGTLLLDPQNIEVTFGADTPADLAANDQFSDPPALGTSFISSATIDNAASNVFLRATNDINFNAPINIIAAGVGIEARAGNSISTQGFGNGTITTNGGDVNLVANDASALFLGTLTINDAITTNGGAINLVVTTNPSASPASALTINNATLSSGTGDISLRGGNNNLGTGITDGITINGFSSIISTSGNITLDGDSNGRIGINVPESANVTIASDSGSIRLTGLSTGASGGDGIGIIGGIPLSGNVKKIETNSGNIEIIGNALNPVTLGINIRPPSGNATLIINGGTGDITFTSDKSAFPNIGLQGSGTITLQPFSNNPLVINGGVTNFSGSTSNIFADSSFFSTFAGSPNFSNIVIGNATTSNQITALGSGFIGFASPATIQSPAGNGTINTSGLEILTTGSITLLANQNITTGTITAAGNAISITSNLGTIDVKAIDTSSVSSSGGNVSLQAAGNVKTSVIVTNAASGGGALQIVSGGNIDITGGVTTDSFPGPTGNGGDVTLTANGNITTGAGIDGNIDFFGLNLLGIDVGGGGNANNSGNITITSNNGFINTSAGQLIARTGLGNGGDITLQALGNVTTNGVWTYVDGAEGNGNAGKISLTSLNGSINSSLGQLLSYNATGNGTGNSGNISLNAVNGNISTGNLIDGNTTSTSSSSNAGSLTINGLNITNIGNINLSANAGKAGDITLSGNLPLSASTTFSTNSGGINGNIDLGNADVTGNQSLTLNAGSGNVTLGAIGTSTTPLSALQVISGNTTLNNDIYTSNFISFLSPISLANNVSLNSGDIFVRNVDGNNSLFLNARLIVSDGVFGGATPLASLTINPTSTLFFSSNDINISASGDISTGAIQFATDNNARSNNGNVTIQTAGTFTPNSQDITTGGGFVSLIADGGINNLGNITTGGGDVTITSSLGDIISSPNTTIITNNSFRFSSGNISITATNGSLNLQNLDASADISDGRTLAGNISLNAGSNSEILVGNLVANNNNFSGDAGSISFNAGTGNITIGGSTIDVSSTNGNSTNLVFPRPVIINSGNITLGLRVSTIGNVKFDNTITSPNTSSLTIDSENVTFSNTIGSLAQPIGDLTINPTGTSTFASPTFANTIISGIFSGNTIINGNLTATGLQGNRFQQGSGGISLGNFIINGNISLTGNEINLFGNATGNGNLVLSPFSVGQAIVIGGIGDTGFATLDIATRYLSALTNGTLSSLTIGNPLGSGAITLAGNTSFNQPTTIQSPAGNGTINTSGFNLTNTGGSITLLANQNITTRNITAAGNAIAITSTSGAIDTSFGVIDSRFAGAIGNGGDIKFQARNDIKTGTLISSATSNGNGGLISLITTNGTIDTSFGQDTSGQVISRAFGATGNGGDISYQALGNILGNITTGNIFSSSENGNGGLISLITTNGAIDTSLGEVSSRAFGATGNGGNITFNSQNGNSINGNFINAGTNSTNASSTAGSLTINALNITSIGSINLSANAGTAGDINLSGNLPLTANTTFSTNSGGVSGNINLGNATVTGNQSLTLNAGTGNVILGAIGTSATPLVSLDVTSGNTAINNDIFTSSSLNFNSPVTLVNNVALNSNGNINFGNSVNGAKDLIANSGTGNLTFNAAVGDVTSLGNITANSLGITRFNNTVNAASLTTDASGTAQLNGNVTTSGAQTYNDAVNLTNTVQLNTTNSAIAFNNTINGTQDLTLNSGTGNLIFNGAIGNSATLGNITANSSGITRFGSTVNVASLTTDAGGTTQLNGNVTTSGAQTYNDAVNLTNTVQLNTTNSAIAFNNTINGNGNGTQNLTLNSGTGNLTFDGAVGNSAPLGNITVNSSGTTRFNSTVNATSLTTDALGTTELDGNVTTTDAQTYNDAVTLTNPVQLNTTNSAIAFKSTVNGTQDLTASTGTGNIDFTGAVGAANVTVNSTGTTRFNSAVNAASLTTNIGGTTELNGNVTTTGNQTFGDNLIIGTNITFNADSNNDSVGTFTNQGSIAGSTNTISIRAANVNIGGEIRASQIFLIPSTTNPTIAIGSLASGNFKLQDAAIPFLKANLVAIAANNGDVNIAGNQTFSTGTNLEIGSALSPVNLVTAVSGSNLNVNGNLSTTGKSITLGNTTVGGDLVIRLSEKAAQTGVITVGGKTTFIIDSNPLTEIFLADFANSFGDIPTQLSFIDVPAFDFKNLEIRSISNNTNFAFAPNTINNLKLILDNGTINVASTPLTGSLTLSARDVILSGNLSPTTADLSGGNITLNNNFSTTSGRLAIANTGLFKINSGVNLNVAGSFVQSGPGTVDLGGNIINASSVSFFAQSITLSGDTEINSSGDITFASTLNGNQALVLNAGTNPILFSEKVGGTTPLASLSINLASTSIGNLDVTTTGNITTGAIRTFGNSVFLTSNSGTINTSDITTNAFSSQIGNITLTANGNLTTGNIAAKGSPSEGGFTGSGGNVNLTSQTGKISTDNVDTSGQIGGEIFFNAFTAIDAGNINSSGLLNAGNVTLDPSGDVVVSSIDASSPTTGGNVKLVSTRGNLRITDTILSSLTSTCVGASICTTGGNITLETGGLNPFAVGDASINGSKGIITTGLSTFSLGTSIPALLASSFSQGGISITPGGFIPVSNVPENNTFEPPSKPDVIVTTNSDDQKLLAIRDVLKREVDRYLIAGNLEKAFDTLEQAYIAELEIFTGSPLDFTGLSLEKTQERLSTIAQQSGDVAALIYPILLDNRIEILVIPPQDKGQPFRKFTDVANKEMVDALIGDYRNNIRDVSSKDYLEQSQKLYDLIIRPIDQQLTAMKINTLVFVMDGGLRVTPPAALHDGKQFLIERYAIANVPSIRATRVEERDRKATRILAMGLTESVAGFSALPSVDIEIKTIASEVLKGSSFLNKDFTVSNLQNQRQQGNYSILHLGTHAKFVSDTSQESFIQFWDSRLRLSDIAKLRFDNPAIDMLTLSACETAVGNNLGISGLAIESGARSVLASLWAVSDSGTAPLMISFYKAYPDGVNKAQSMQQAQIQLLTGKVNIRNNQITGITGFPNIPLPTGSTDIDLSHPFYWSSFILVGNWL